MSFTLQIEEIKRNSISNTLADSVCIRWLGQAGFELLYRDTRLIVDPYLSDFLAQKYRGREFPHIRMMLSPLEPHEVHSLDWLLCTHRHSDHMDPATIPVILQNNPKCTMVAPKAHRRHVAQIGIDLGRVLFLDAGDTILTPAVKLQVLASAHEDFKTDEFGCHHYLGYIISFGDLKIYHSGDCIAYPGLAEQLLQKKVDIALLPVNGRDDDRTNKGIPGNFTFDEAVELCKLAGVQGMICHHFDMFEFNTVDRNWLCSQAAAVSGDSFKCFVPNVRDVFQINKL